MTTETLQFLGVFAVAVAFLFAFITYKGKRKNDH
jgi:hypothetical protein